MIDPYRMVYINILSIFIVGILIFGYRYVYPKKKLNLFVCLLLILIPPIINLFRPGSFESGDFNIHVTRIMTFYDTLSEGNLMPSWAGELNATYGNPLFIFNYPLPYYIVSFFHFLGFGFIASMKIFLGMTLYLSGIFMYLAVNKLLKNEIAAFSAAIFYVFNPYHLIDVHFRATAGESTLFMIAPLMIYFVTSFLREKQLKHLIAISLTTILLSLSHPMVSLTIHGVIIIFAITLRGIKNKKRLIVYLFLALIFGFISSLYVWLPFLIFKDILYPDTLKTIPFLPFHLLFYSPYRYGFLFQGNYGELPPVIGYSQLFLVILGFFLYFKTDFFRKIRFQYLMWFAILFVLIYFMHPSSEIIWRHFKILWMLGDRLPLAMSLCTTMISAYIAYFFSKKKSYQKFIFIFIVLTILSTILNWGHRRVIPEIGDKQLKAGVWQSTAAFGHVWFLRTKWEEYELINELPKKHLEIIKGKGDSEEIYRDTTKHIYVLSAETPVTIKENTLWFPGWSLKSNYKDVEITPGKRGIINAKLSSGLQYIEFNYSDIALLRYLKLFALSSFVILLFLYVVFSFKYTNKVVK